MNNCRLDIVNGHVWKNTGAVVRRNDKEFIYTLNDGDGLLTSDQRLFYEHNGYLVLPNLISHQIIDKCRDRFVDLCEGKAPKGSIVLMKDISTIKMKGDGKGEALYYKAQDILFDEIFIQYFSNDKLLDVVQCITGPDIRCMHSMLINKPPDVGTLSSRHPLHQDLYYFPFRPANRIVASWTAMERIDETNGCLFVLPGTHRGVLLQHEYPDWEGGVNKAFHGIPHKDDHPKTFLHMEKGDTVFFHPLLIHGSEYNQTKGFRKAISGHFAWSNGHYINVEGTVQEEISNEIVAMMKKKGFDASFQDIWRYRSRHMRGNMGSL